jgi:molybdenum-dependent DNA-binding transcriptional regulator ModE
LLQSTVEVRPLSAAALKEAAEQLPAQPEQADPAKLRAELLGVLDSPAGQQTLAFLQRGEAPRPEPAPALDPEVKAALDAVENLTPDEQLIPLLARVSPKSVDGALLTARDRAQAFDATTKPINDTIDKLENLLARQVALVQTKSGGPQSGSSITRDFTAARLRFASQRYESEARLNQSIATFYELQVRKSNFSAERHHNRSQRFFFGMLAAQLGVIVSTLAMAARQRNLLWSLAALAGLAAIAFAIYVYLCV